MMIVVMLVLSYLIGAFPSGLVIGKLFFKKILDSMAVAILEQQIAFVF